MVDFPVILERMALITIDMQNCFVEGYPLSAPDGLVVLDHINRLAEVCRETGMLVVHIREVLRSDGTNAGVFGEIHPFVKDGFFSRDSEAAALHKELVVDPADILLEKPRYGAFHATDLEMILRTHGIDTLIITGSRPMSAVRRPHVRRWSGTFRSSFSVMERRRAGLAKSQRPASKGDPCDPRCLVRPSAHRRRDDSEDQARRTHGTQSRPRA